MDSYRKPRAAEGGELVFSRDELPGRVYNPQGSLLNTGTHAHLDLEGGVCVTIIITEEAVNSTYLDLEGGVTIIITEEALNSRGHWGHKS